MSHAQQPIWIGQRLDPESPLYNMTFAWALPPGLDLTRFVRAFAAVADGHEVLRTTVVECDGRGVAQTLPAGAIGTVVRDSVPDEASFLRWCAARCARPLALGGPLVDSVLVPLPDGRTGWYLNQHHLVTDAWSTGLLFRQVAAWYEVLADGGGEPPAPLPDYASTANALLASPRGREAAAAHWSGRLDAANRQVDFYGRDGAAVGTASTRTTLELDEARSRALDARSGEDGFASLSPALSRFALFATVLSAWLHRVSGRGDVGFDAPVAGRPSAEAKRALGPFIEMFPFAVELAPTDTFRDLGRKCFAEALAFLQHALPGTSRPSGTAVGNVVLNFVPDAFGDFAGMAAPVTWIHPGAGDRVHAVRLQVHDFSGRGRYTLHLDVNDRVFPETLRRRALCHLEAVLTALIDDPDQVIAALDVRSEAERRLPEGWGDRPSMSEPVPTVWSSFQAQAEATPARIALRRGDDALTFEALRSRAEAVAAGLAARGVVAGEPVAILGNRSIDTVVGILGISRARAAYVPVDPTYPPHRRAHILRDAGVRLVLVDGEVGTSFAAALDELDVATAVVTSLEAEGEGEAPGPEPVLDDLAYVLYTSGSTGEPKGVLVDHRGLAEYVSWAAEHYVRGETWRFPLFTSLSFDLTVTSLFLPLVTGGTLEVYPLSDGPADTALFDVLEADAVDFIKLTPSHLALWRQLEGGGRAVRCAVVGGEDFRTPLAAEMHARLRGRAEIYNEYGPTEAIVGCVVHRFDPEVDTAPRVPIGAPPTGVEVTVRNEAGAPVPDGVPGELWVTRRGLALGYLGRPGLTAQRFVPREERPSDDGSERWYRTGDLVRLVSTGTLEYLGRLDRQLKVAGFRVEPAEIESALLAVPSIERAAVVVRYRAAPPARPKDDGRHCTRCGLPSSHPSAVLDREGVCTVCRTYASIRAHAQGYFKTMADLEAVFAASSRAHDAPFDCMMLLSGGKDSTYALARLVEMGLRVYAFTLDNGFIAEGAKANIRRVTEQLGVPVEFATTPAMNAIFRDSLQRFANVCQGCFKTIYTLSVQRARALGIPVIVTGLSRGQMFETRLTEEMFRDGERSPEEVDAAVLAARKVYHRVDDEVARSLDVGVFRDDSIFDEIRFVDFYRYCDVGLTEMLGYLRRVVPWVRPEDTGRSTNCLINDVGIYVHKQQRGFHNYALPYSWDVRMGHKTRDEARDELEDEIDVQAVRGILAEIGCDPDAMTADAGQPQLVAYYVAAEGSETLSDDRLRTALAERLPMPLRPARFQRLDAIPLTVHGKVDVEALPDLEAGARSDVPFRSPEGPVEAFLAEAWQDQLGVERIGGDDSFFALGGTSLAAMEVMIRLCRTFDIELPLDTLFAHPTLSGLAYVAEERILADVEGMEEG